MTASDPFPSLAALHEAHVGLLRQPRDHRDTTEFRARVEEFMTRAQATGRLLDEGPDRSEAQTALDYWASFLYRDSPEQLLSVALAPCEEAVTESFLPDSACPYPEPYATGIDAGRFFFGRSRLVDELSKRLESSRFVAVVGPSGSGKRSLVLAGLVPALARQAKSARMSPMPNFVLTPGFQPFENLARAVPPDENIRREALALKADAAWLTTALDAVSAGPSLLIVDRFEEVFAEECLQSDRAAFANSLAELVRSKRGHRLVLILDSEFGPLTKEFGPLEDLFKRATFEVPLLSAGDLREIIVHPAELVGLHIDPVVVDRLVNDVAGDPSALALVQYALERLWKKRTGNRISASAYDELGSAQHAFSLTADEIYRSMPDEQQKIARQVFLHLVRMEPSGRVVARGASRQDLLSSLAGTSLAELNAVLDQLVKERLLRQDQSGERFDIATKGLVTRWPTLMHWLAEQRQSREKRTWLTLAAKQWSENGRLRCDLLRARALKSVRQLPLADLSPLEREFIKESRAADDRRRLKLIGTALVAVSLILLCLYYLNLRLKETLAHMMLERGERQLEIRDPAGAALWFQEALKESNSLFNYIFSREVNEIHRVRIGCALRQIPALLRLHPEQGLINAEFNTGGDKIALAARKQDKSYGGAWLWNLKTSQEPEQLDKDLPVNRAVFSDSGSGSEELVATASGEIGKSGAVRIWSTRANQPDRKVGEHSFAEEAPTDVAFHPLNQNLVGIGTVLTDSKGGGAYLWNRQLNNLTKLSAAPDNRQGVAVNSVAFSRDGKWFAVGCGAPDSNAGEARVYSAVGDGAGELLATFPHQWPVMRVDFDSVGEQLVTASGSRSSGGGEARIYKQQTWADTKSPQQDTPNQMARLRIVTLHHALGVVSAKFNPCDPRLVLTASNDGTAKVWDGITGRELAELRHEAGVFDAGWSPDGRFVISGGRDRTARVWEALTGQLLLPQLDAGGTAIRTTFSPTGRQVLVTTLDRALLWDLWPRNELRTAPILTDGSVTAAALSSNGSLLAVATLPQDKSQRGLVQIVQTETGDVLETIRLGGIVKDLAFYTMPDPKGRNAKRKGSSDNALLALATEDRSRRGGKIQVWNVLKEGVSLKYELKHAGRAFISVMFNEDDGSRILAVSKSKGEYRLHILDTSDGSSFTKIPPDPRISIRAAAISPDGKMVAAVGGAVRPRAGTGYLWKISQEEPEQRRLEDEEEFTCVTFSGDSNSVVTGSADDEVKVWQADTGRRYLESVTMKHTADVAFVAFSPRDSGPRILSGALDGTAVVWDASDGSRIAQFRHGGAVGCGAFSPKDGSFVITGGKDELARIWNVGPGKRHVLHGIWNKVASLFRRTPGDPVAVLPLVAIPDQVGFASDGGSVFAYGKRFPARLDDLRVASRGSADISPYHPDSRSQLPLLLRLRRWKFSAAENQDDDLPPVVAARNVEQGIMDILKPEDWTERWKHFVKKNGEPKLDLEARSPLRGARFAAAARQWEAVRWHMDRALKQPNGNSTPALDAKELLLSVKANSELKAYTNVKSAAEPVLKEESKSLPEPIRAELFRLLSEALAANNERPAAIEALKSVEKLTGPDSFIQIRIAELHIDSNDWKKAVEALEQSRKLELVSDGGPSPGLWQRLASVYLTFERDSPGEYETSCKRKYEETCEEMLKEFGAIDEFAAIVVWPWLLREYFPERDDPQRAQNLRELAERAVRDDPKNPYRLNTLGVLHYRQQNYKEAIATLENSCRAYASQLASRPVNESEGIVASEASGSSPSTHPDGRPKDWIFLAMANAQLAKVVGEKERQTYDTRAKAWLDQVRRGIDQPSDRLAEKWREFWDRLEMNLFLAEADRVCAKPTSADNL